MTSDDPTAADDAHLSRLLFEARELADTFIDVVRSRTGRVDAIAVRVRDDIDAYRAGRGWSPHGYGGEDEPEPTGTR